MPKDTLKVATITANYNTGKYFPECLQGLLNQTRKPDKLVVIDDGSTDDSWKSICACFPDVNSLKSHHNLEHQGIECLLLQLDQNRGPSFARNVGLQYLVDKTDAICIADADDIYYPTKIEKSINVMKEYPNVALVYSDYDTENMQTGEVKREFKEIFSYKRLFQRCIVSNNSVIASRVFHMVGGYDDSLRGGEDYDLWLRIAEVAAVHHIPEALYRYRLTGMNSTVTIPQEQFSFYVNRVHEKARERRDRSMTNES